MHVIVCLRRYANIRCCKRYVSLVAYLKAGGMVMFFHHSSHFDIPTACLYGWLPLSDAYGIILHHLMADNHFYEYLRAIRGHLRAIRGHLRSWPSLRIFVRSLRTVCPKPSDEESEAFGRSVRSLRTILGALHWMTWNQVMVTIIPFGCLLFIHISLRCLRLSPRPCKGSTLYTHLGGSSPEGAMDYRQGQRPCIAQHNIKPRRGGRRRW